MNLTTLYDYSQVLTAGETFTAPILIKRLDTDERAVRRHLVEMTRLGLITRTAKHRGPRGCATYTPSPELVALYPRYRATLTGQRT
jgi:hypothetical protein